LALIFRSVAARHHNSHRRPLSHHEKDSVVRTLAELEHDGATTDELEQVAERAFLHLTTRERPQGVTVRRIVKAIDEKLFGEFEEDDQSVEVEHAVAEAEPVPVEEIDNIDDYVAARRAEDEERDRNR
jgi:hypothetical protein